MKTMKLVFTRMWLAFLLIINIIGFSQSKVSIAVIGIDTKGTKLDNISMGNLVRLELEKTNHFEVFDKYDVNNLLSAKGVDPDKCYGKIKLIEAGKILGVEKILTGSVEKFGEKIIFVLRMIDVKSEKIENTNVMEYLNLEDQIQIMAKLSVNNIIGIVNDKLIVDLLIDYDNLVSSPKTTVRLNGPRMGVAFFMGKSAKRMEASKDEGGYNMYPISSVFGYQYEFQYLSAGDFQALVEVVGAFSGLETGNFIPSVSVMNGFRFNKNGWEFALGPIFRFTRVAEGYYDENGNWHLTSAMPLGKMYPLENAIDNRGDVNLSASLIIGVGRTFRSGYLNIPVNIYYIPRKEGGTIGLNFGFNIAKKQNK
ncbi:MAG: hypothetical protein WCL51_03455 [Bacteroidota bacterium]